MEIKPFLFQSHSSNPTCAALTIIPKRIHIKVYRLMIQEQFAQQRQVPTPPPLHPPINLPETDCPVVVDLIPGRVEQGALGSVAVEGADVREVFEAEGAEVEGRDVGEFLCGT